MSDFPNEREYKIVRNMAQCLVCGDVIESTYRHDFVRCTCGNLAVDGGKAYLKRSAQLMDQVEEMSTYDPPWVESDEPSGV